MAPTRGRAAYPDRCPVRPGNRPRSRPPCPELPAPEGPKVSARPGLAKWSGRAAVLEQPPRTGQQAGRRSRSASGYAPRPRTSPRRKQTSHAPTNLCRQVSRVRSGHRWSGVPVSYRSDHRRAANCAQTRAWQSTSRHRRQTRRPSSSAAICPRALRLRLPADADAGLRRTPSRIARPTAGQTPTVLTLAHRPRPKAKGVHQPARQSPRDDSAQRPPHRLVAVNAAVTSLLAAPPMKANSGRKARNPAVPSATAGRSGRTARTMP